MRGLARCSKDPDQDRRCDSRQLYARICMTEARLRWELHAGRERPTILSRLGGRHQENRCSAFRKAVICGMQDISRLRAEGSLDKDLGVDSSCQRLVCRRPRSTSAAWLFGEASGWSFEAVASPSRPCVRTRGRGWTGGTSSSWRP